MIDRLGASATLLADLTYEVSRKIDRFLSCVVNYFKIGKQVSDCVENFRSIYIAGWLSMAKWTCVCRSVGEKWDTAALTAYSSFAVMCDSVRSGGNWPEMVVDLSSP